MKADRCRLIFLLSFVLCVAPITASAVQAADPIFGPDRVALTSSLKAEPDQFDGSLLYEYPLTLPPGRNKMSPGLALVYSSKNTDQLSPFGYGWSLNIPYIERVNRKGANKLYSDPVFLSTLDGELKATSSPATEGYGALVDSGDFRQYEFEGSNYWRVTDKYGTIYTFGSATTSQVYDAASSTRVYRWLLEEVRDRNDNYIEYEYYKDNGQIYPYKIRYTGSGSTDGIYEIEFIRENRSDIATSSAPGFTLVSKYRISEIQIKLGGAWQHKYALGYGTGDNGTRAVLASVTESGKDESGMTTALPAVSFAYTTKDADWAYTSSWVMPAPFVDNPISTDVDWGARFDDFNGDGWTDIAWYRDSDSAKIYMNNGDGSWATTTPTGLNLYVTASGDDIGSRSGDVDGDGLADSLGNSSAVKVNTDRGSTFVTDSNWALPADFAFAQDNTYWDKGARLFDINGDGLPDFVRSYDPDGGYGGENGIYLNNGAGWDATTTNAWTLPSGLYFAGIYSPNHGVDRGVRFADFNGDGLTDIIRSNDATTPNTIIYFNKGDGTWATTTPSGWPAGATIVEQDGTANSYQIADVNADGLADLVDTASASTQSVYLNRDGGYTFSSAGWSSIVPDFTQTGLDRGARFTDIDGDGILDIVRSYYGSASPDGQNGAYLGNGVIPDLLKKVTTDAGGTISFGYKSSPQYVNGSAELNSRLPMVLQTVETITANNGFGTVGTTTYAYGGGEYYYANEFDRKFAGFATTTITDSSGHVTKTYSHQGNGSQASIGENADGKAKIGRVYRTEVYDESGNLYTKKIEKWETATTTNGRVFLKRTRMTEFAYDGDADHKDRATTFTYDDSIGNLSSKVELGEVTGSDDGSYTDTGSDTRTTSYAYATSSAHYVYVFPMTETIKDNGGTRVAERKFYYDNLSHGSVSIGNLTKDERWITGSTYASSTKAYDSYGLVTSEIDPRGKTSTISYESANMYMATTTNPLSHVIEYYRDMTSGKAKKVVDPNGRSFEVIFDGLDRVATEKIPDHLGIPANTIAKSAYAYTDTSGARRVQRTDYLNTATSTDTYTYLDGFMRPIQERRESEDGYFIKDIQYDARGDIQKESLPYSGSGSARTTITTTGNLLVTYSYDPLHRATSIANAKGTENHAYDQWKETTTDRNGEIKDLTSDAFGKLSQVDEHNGGGTYTTSYTYDSLGNLTRISDAASNLRNFTYDGLSRLTNSEDLHASGDGIYGTRSYTHDVAGNVTSTTDSKTQTIDYTYDDINRVVTENYTGGSGTEIQYGYDWCSNGKGRLCSATTTNIVTNHAYDALGNIATEARTIDSTTYTTTFTRDRLNNLTNIVYPNSREVRYDYNVAGQLESIHTKPSGGSYSAVVQDLDYAPTSQISYKLHGNDVESTYTRDAAELYRLRTIYTSPVGMGGFGDASLPDAGAPDPSVLLHLGGVDTSATSTETAGIPESESVSIPTTDATSPEQMSEALPNETAVRSDNSGAATTESAIYTIAPETANELAPLPERQQTKPIVADIVEGIVPQASIDADVVNGGWNFTTTPAANGLLQTDFSARWANYKTEDGWAAINTDFALSVDGTYFEMVSAPFFVSAPLTSTGVAVMHNNNQWNIFTNEEIVEDPLDMRIRAADVQDVQGRIERGDLVTPSGIRKDVNYVVYRDAYPNADLIYYVDFGIAPRLAKLIRFKSKPSIFDYSFEISYSRPTEIGTPQRETRLIEQAGEFAFEQDIRVWNKNADLVSEKGKGLNVRAEDSQVRGIGMKEFQIWDSAVEGDNRRIESIDVTIKPKGKESYRLTKHIPAQFFDSAIYPVYTDTTTTFYPNAHPESTSVDGSIRRNDSSNWDSVHDATDGNAAWDDNSWFGITTEKDSSYHIVRSFFLFDTSAIPNDDVISSATFSLKSYSFAKVNTDNDGDDFIRIIGSTPASGTSLSTGDYDQCGATDNPTALATDVDFGSLASASNWQDFSLNATGMAAISKTGITKLCAREGHDVVDSPISDWTKNLWNVYFAESGDAPILTVIHAPVNATPTAPTLLQTESQTNPTDVSDPTPEFSAIFNDSDVSDRAAFYQIQVATSSDYWSAPHWDSGKATTTATTTAGSRSEQIAYTGTALASSTTYYWRIKFWDQSNLSSDYSTSTASFSLAASAATSTIGYQNLRFYYDSVGNITIVEDFSNTDTKKIVFYGYDDLHRLTSASTTLASTTPYSQTYAYSNLGNITSKSDVGSYTYAGTGYVNPHAATSINGVTYSYDNNGNVTGFASTTYSWDYRDRLTQVATGTASTSHAYDHDNIRIKKVVQGSATTTYPNPYYNVSDTGTTTVHILLPDGTPVAVIDSGTIYYIHTDHLGGTGVLTNASGTAISELTDYYPYGTQRVHSGSYTEQKKYIGEHYDDEADLSYLNARYYSGDRGHFISQDPVFWEVGQTGDGRAVLTNPQAQNSYSYGQNNPMVNKDPAGRAAVGIGVNVGGNTPGMYGETSGYFVLTVAGNPFNVEVGYISSANGGGTTALGGGEITPALLFSNARSISELEGPEAVFGGSGRIGLDAGVDVSLSKANNSNRKIVTVNPSFGLGLVGTPYGLPAEVHGGGGYTKALASVNLTKGVTNAANATKAAVQSASISLQRQLQNVQKQVNQIQKQINQLQKAKNSKK